MARRTGRPQDVEEALENRDDMRLAARTRRPAAAEPTHLSQIRRIVLFETAAFVTVDDIAKSLNVSEALVGICMPYLSAEGLLSEHRVLPPGLAPGPGQVWASRSWRDRLDSEVEVCGVPYVFRDGRWLKIELIPNGKFRRTSRTGRSNRNVPLVDVKLSDGPWDGRGFEITRGAGFVKAAEEHGMLANPVGDWECGCHPPQSNRWDKKSCALCGSASPRSIVLAASNPLTIKAKPGPELRPCVRCGLQVRVKRRGGKVVRTTHSRSVCNVEVARSVIAM